MEDASNLDGSVTMMTTVEMAVMRVNTVNTQPAQQTTSPVRTHGASNRTTDVMVRMTVMMVVTKLGVTTPTPLVLRTCSSVETKSASTTNLSVTKMMIVAMRVMSLFIVARMSVPGWRTTGVSTSVWTPLTVTSAHVTLVTN